MSGSNVAMQIAIRPSGAGRSRLGGCSGVPASMRASGATASPFAAVISTAPASMVTGTTAQKRPPTHAAAWRMPPTLTSTGSAHEP